MRRQVRPVSLVSVISAFEIAVALIGCSRPPAPATTPEDAAAVPSEPAAEDAAVADAATEIVDAAPPVHHYKTVLLTGDSMVGWSRYGLNKALRSRFEADGSRFFFEPWNSASITSVANGKRLSELLTIDKPDLVLLTLGTNDVFVPRPEALTDSVRAIVKKMGGRDCAWISPPLWKGDRGIVKIIRDNAAPCRFFDSSNLKLARIDDGIHPTDEGGETWGGEFWEFFRNSSAQASPIAFVDDAGAR